MLKKINLLGRENSLFQDDITDNEEKLNKYISSSSILILGGAGTIGQAVTKEIFKRNPLKLHIVDINENNLAELVRDIRASYGYIKGEFKVYSIDIGSEISPICMRTEFIIPEPCSNTFHAYTLRRKELQKGMISIINNMFLILGLDFAT